jgi:hypothetical protein
MANICATLSTGGSAGFVLPSERPTVPSVIPFEQLEPKFLDVLGLRWSVSGRFGPLGAGPSKHVPKLGGVAQNTPVLISPVDDRGCIWSIVAGNILITGQLGTTPDYRDESVVIILIHLLIVVDVGASKDDATCSVVRLQCTDIVVVQDELYNVPDLWF